MKLFVTIKEEGKEPRVIEARYVSVCNVERDPVILLEDDTEIEIGGNVELTIEKTS